MRQRDQPLGEAQQEDARGAVLLDRRLVELLAQLVYAAEKRSERMEALRR